MKPRDHPRHHHTSPPKGEKKLGTMRPAFIAINYNKNTVLFSFLEDFLDPYRLGSISYKVWKRKVYSLER